MSSDVEDGEIVGDVNDYYATCVQPSEPEPCAPQHGNASYPELLPVWDRVKHLKWDENDDDLLAGTVGSGKKKAKKEKKKNKKHSAAAAAAASGQGTYLNVYGENPRAHAELKATHPIQLRDVQQLVLWVLGDAVSPRWVFLRNKPLIPAVVLVLANGLTQQLLEDHKDVLPHLSMLPAPAVTLALNSHVRPGAHLLCSVILLREMCGFSDETGATGRTRKRKRDAKTEQEVVKQQRNGQPPFPPEHYILKPQEMQALGYHDLLGLDCEMCITSAGFELTRVTVVDAAGAVLLDELVVPDNPITDYNTRYSGITAAMLQGVTTKLADIQVCHSRVIDTVALFPHPRGLPYKSSLKFLSSKFLKRSIQEGEHDSAQDARAAMDLALLKIGKGPSYGLPDAACGGVDKLPDVLAASGQHVSSCLVDRQGMLSKHATGHASAVLATHDMHGAEAAAKQVQAGRYGFVWLQLHGLADFYFERSKVVRKLGAAKLREQVQLEQGVLDKSEQQAHQQQEHVLPKNAVEGGAPPPVETVAELEHLMACQYSQQQLLQKLSTLDKAVHKVWEALPQNALLLVATGQGDTPDVRRQQELKIRREQRLDGLPPWSTPDEEAFAAAVEQHMKALCFCAVKHGASP
eukprot:gene6259-6497_t